MTYSIPKAAADLAIKASEEDRIIGDEWHRRGDDGRDYVCALAAFAAPGTIKSVSDCPAAYMPRWLAELIPTMDDGLPQNSRAWFARGLAERGLRWSVITDAGWSRIEAEFKIECVEVALNAARAVQPSPAPDYWLAVEAACKQVIDALRSGDAKKIEAAEAAVKAAAWAAKAAAKSAAWAAKAAAKSAAWAAEAAAWAAEAAWAAWAAAWAAEAAAWQRLSNHLFQAIDARIAQGGAQ